MVLVVDRRDSSCGRIEDRQWLNAQTFLTLVGKNMVVESNNGDRCQISR